MTTPAWRRPSALWGYLAAHTISTTGTRISAIAIPWFVLTTTGSATRTGIVALCEMLPLVIAMALGGPIIDRVGARRISIWADIASTVAVGAIPALHALGMLSFGALLVLVAIAGALRGPGETAKATLVPDVAAASGVALERVTGLSGTSDRTAQIVGPAVAGALIAAFGPVTAIVLDAASFAGCALLIRLSAPAAQPERPAGEAGAAAGEAAYLRRLGDGWRYLISDPLLRAVALMVCLTNLLDQAYSSVLLPVWMRSHGFGPAEIGVTGSAFGVAATVASLLAAGYGHRLPRRVVYFVGFALAGAPRFLALAFGAPLAVIVAVGAVSGFGSGFINPILMAVFVQRIPRGLLGRVSALADAVAWAGIPFGGVIAGIAIAGIGLAPALLVAGTGYLLTTTLPGLLPHWRSLDESPQRRRADPDRSLPQQA